MESYMPLIIQLLFGAVGGNLAGAIMKNLSLGTMWNSIVGILGGGIGGTLLGLLGMGGTEVTDAASSLDIGAVVGSVAGGGIGGGILLTIVGFFRNSSHK